MELPAIVSAPFPFPLQLAKVVFLNLSMLIFVQIPSRPPVALRIKSTCMNVTKKKKSVFFVFVCFPPFQFIKQAGCDLLWASAQTVPSA